MQAEPINPDKPAEVRVLSSHLYHIKEDTPCAWCGKTIPKGKPYRRISFMCDGDFKVEKVHLDCFHGWR